MLKRWNVKKSAALLLSLCIFAVTTFFVAFEAANEIHDCTGTDCPICHELQIAQQLTRQVSTALGLAAVVFFFAVSIKNIGMSLSDSYSQRNLILDKVRMDN